MKKETLANKLARKSFESKKIQDSWQVHLQAFGPILKPAFIDNYQAKIHLTAALNHISNKDFKKAVPKLQEVTKHVETDADKASFLFFMGLCFDIAGDIPNMMEMYINANEYEHCFYLPYMKVAKIYQKCCKYEDAVMNYTKAIECFEPNNLSKQDKLILASAYTNMASCYTMKHRYDKAQYSLEMAHRYGDIPDTPSAEAILHAVLQDEDNMHKSMEKLKTSSSPLYETTRKMVESIINKTNPAFFPIDTDAEKIDLFWQWFDEYRVLLLKRLASEQYEEGIIPITEKLLETFPFLGEPPILSLGENEKGYVLELRDLYLTAIKSAFDELLLKCPSNISEEWQFVIVH